MKKSAMVIALSAVAVVACSKAPETTSNAAASASITHAVVPAPSVAVAPPSPFEGEILVSVTSGATQKLPAAITYDIKGNKLKYSSASNLRAIDDQTAQHAYTIDDTKKSYEDIDTSKPMPNTKAPADPTVQKLGKSEMIAGISCDDWTIDTGDTKVDVCAASNTAFFDLDRDTKLGVLEPQWATALTKAKAFPLRAVVHDKSGKEQYRLLATKVDRKKIDDTTFTVPTTFAKTDLAADEKQNALP
ncbi:MAG: DUF4412 domain-containing protein [Polyangiaceae bacterium]